MFFFHCQRKFNFFNKSWANCRPITWRESSSKLPNVERSTKISKIFLNKVEWISCDVSKAFSMWTICFISKLKFKTQFVKQSLRKFLKLIFIFTARKCNIPGNLTTIQLVHILVSLKTIFNKFGVNTRAYLDKRFFGTLQK